MEIDHPDGLPPGSPLRLLSPPASTVLGPHPHTWCPARAVPAPPVCVFAPGSVVRLDAYTSEHSIASRSCPPPSAKPPLWYTCSCGCPSVPIVSLPLPDAAPAISCRLPVS